MCGAFEWCVCVSGPHARVFMCATRVTSGQKRMQRRCRWSKLEQRSYKAETCHLWREEMRRRCWSDSEDRDVPVVPLWPSLWPLVTENDTSSVFFKAQEALSFPMKSPPLCSWGFSIRARRSGWCLLCKCFKQSLYGANCAACACVCAGA